MKPGPNQPRPAKKSAAMMVSEVDAPADCDPDPDDRERDRGEELVADEHPGRVLSMPAVTRVFRSRSSLMSFGSSVRKRPMPRLPESKNPRRPPVGRLG
jgi:hypothetical protein